LRARAGLIRAGISHGANWCAQPADIAVL